MALSKCASSVTVNYCTGYTRLGSCLWRPCETPLFSLGSSFAQDFPHAPDKLELSASHAKLGRIWHVRAGDMPTSSAAGASAAWGARMRATMRRVRGPGTAAARARGTQHEVGTCGGPRCTASAHRSPYHVCPHATYSRKGGMGWSCTTGVVRRGALHGTDLRFSDMRWSNGYGERDTSSSHVPMDVCVTSTAYLASPNFIPPARVGIWVDAPARSPRPTERCCCMAPTCASVTCDGLPAPARPSSDGEVLRVTDLRFSDLRWYDENGVWVDAPGSTLQR